MKPQTRALILVVVLVAALIFSLTWHTPQWSVALPAAIFYALLIFNTFFSVRFFSFFMPDIWPQRIIDTILVILYVVMILHINDPLYFSLILSIFFALATIKYIQILGIVNQPRLLKRKIMADCLGAVLALLVLTGVLMGHAIGSLWALVIIFAIANVYVLKISPLYRLDN